MGRVAGIALYVESGLQELEKDWRREHHESDPQQVMGRHHCRVDLEG